MEHTSFDMCTEYYYAHVHSLHVRQCDTSKWMKFYIDISLFQIVKSNSIFVELAHAVRWTQWNRINSKTEHTKQTKIAHI